ncbi:MAG: efflux RND transporter periplasmic adaptor subunit [Candidatus Ozemobacteraceae bacterium]
MEERMTLRMWLQLIEVRLRFIGLLLVTGLLVGYWDTLTNYWERFTRSSISPTNIVQAVTEFYCPMHPNIIRAQTGNCPICGMPLSQRAKGVFAPLPPNITGRVTISPYRVALAGVKTVPITYQPLVKEIESLGEIVFDERKLARISARFPGRIEKLFVDFVGTGVSAGDSLAEIYSPALITTFGELAANRNAGAGLSSVSDAIRKKLLYWGISATQIEEVLKKGDAEHLSLRSPMSGVVVKKSVVEGQYVEEGMNLFDLANLNVVWLMCKIYEEDASFIKVGQTANFETSAYPGRIFSGTVAFLDPIFEKESRTINVRIDMNNQSMELKPGMFGTAKIQAPLSNFTEFQGIVESVGSATKKVYWCPMHPEVVKSEPGICEKCGGMKLVEKTVSSLPADESIIFSCPMHPEIKSDQPGKCPSCKPYMDMDLEPHRKDSTARGVLSVLETAVIDTGSRKIVYVEQAAGVFEGRLVTLGPRAGIHFPVIGGLQAGDNVVAHGSFLIDAETRLNPVAGAGFLGAGGTQPADAPAPSESPKPSAGHSGHGG